MMATLQNKTKNITLINNLVEAKTYYSKMKGLLGKSSLGNDEGLLIETQSVHTFFMKFTMDAVFVNKDFIVTKVLKNMKPWRITPVYLHSKYVIEFNGGTVNEKNIEVGDKLHVDS